MAIARVIIPGGMIGTLLVGLLVAFPFPSGWEVYNSIEALTLAERPGVTYSSSSNGCEILDNTNGHTLGTYACSTGANSWVVDVDDRWTGKPSLQMETTPVRHTNFQGVQTDNSMAVESRTVTRLRDTYYLDYHTFMFDFRVKTVADSRKVECHYNLLFQQACTIDHETSADLGWTSTRKTVGGETFEGSSFVAFLIMPWQGARIAPKGTIQFGQYVGIMQAIIFEAEAGICSSTPGLFASCPQGNLQVDSPGNAISVLARNAAANMFTLSGARLPTYQFSTASLDDRIPQIILIELPYKLLAGADTTSSLGGGYSNLVPIDYNVHYIVRVDVLLVTGWQPQLDYIDSNANGIKDAGEFTYIDKNNDNKWTAGIDEAVSGTPPAPPPTDKTVTSVKTTTVKEADGTTTTTTITAYSDGTTTTTINKELPVTQPESPPQTGSKLEELGPIPDFRSPAPCELWNISCFFNNAINFPSISNLFSLLTVLAVIVIAIFGASIFIGRRRGR